MDYDYPKDIAEHSKLMLDLEGRIIKQIRVNIVVLEFNVLYIETEGKVFALQGEIGSEILGIREVDVIPELTEQDSYIIRTHSAFEQFVGKKIKQVRMIGEAWNGHGFELSFEGLIGKTMIVQSIYSGDKEKDFDDCIRLGVGTYEWNCEQGSGGNG